MVTKSKLQNGTSTNGAGALELRLHVYDSELIDELNSFGEGRERNDFAIRAMKIGAIALRQAQGRIDADLIRQEGELFVQKMGSALDRHQSSVTEQITQCLKDYFDPDSGRFNERVKRLVDRDGELEQVIRRQVEGDGSTLVKTLSAHVGSDSPLMHLLDPDASNGLIKQLTHSTGEQQEKILQEFSLDHPEGALSRLVTELKKNHGEVGETLESRIEAVTSEFSLDREDSALSRLVGRVETAQKQISSQFSLDDKDSALARMRSELLEILENQNQTNARFQSDVTTALAEMNARKQESERSTRHGDTFEEAVFAFVNKRSQSAGDIATRTGNTTGRIRNNKKGDAVIRLHPDHAAAGAKIVVEAKEDASYTLEKALSEVEEARRNRDAGIGLFVFSALNVSDEIEPFGRYGNDVLIVWDSEDPSTDVVFEAGLSVAKGLCVASSAHNNGEGSDIEEIERAILEIQRQARGLDEITKSANAIGGHVTKILDRARIVRNGLDRQVNVLNERIVNIP